MATYVYDLKGRRLPGSIGNKACNLRRLQAKGFQVPHTLVCTWDAYQRFTQGDSSVLADVERELSPRIDGTRRYAVRSSANIEDGADFSFAGQFRTHLDVNGLPALMAAIQDVWSAARSPNVASYASKLGSKGDGHVDMAVLIQEMVPARLSGVAFSRNPATLADEVVIEAVEGQGTALVQGGVTPLHWVNRNGRWLVQPEGEVVAPKVMQELADQTRRIARILGSDVDLEWVYDGQTIYWVQSRGVTAIKKVTIYSNRISREMLPGIILPLIWSINIPLVNGVWAKLLEEMTGVRLDPLSLARSFYYRGYFNMTAFARIFEQLGVPSMSLERMMGIDTTEPSGRMIRLSLGLLRLAPRLIVFMRRMNRFDKTLDALLPDVEEQYRRFDLERAGSLSETELLSAIDDLYALNDRTVYHVLVTLLLMFSYNGLLRRQLRRVGVDFEHLDLLRGMADLQSYDPNPHLARLHQQFSALDETLQAKIRSSTYAGLSEVEGIEQFRDNVAAFLSRFGHLSDSSSDFSAVPWRENRDLVLRLITSHRHLDMAGDKVDLADIRLKGLSGAMIRALYRKARAFRLYREHINFVYNYGYGLFRVYFLALARRLVERGALAAIDDVFYLERNEVYGLVRGEKTAAECVAAVQRRRTEIESYRNVTAPSIIYGDVAPPVIPADAHKLTGTPSSRGYYTGRVRVVRGIGDFAKLEEGDVLVIPYSDVGWTPLFAKAGAVIAESGGLLSHSSIVAREYGIPAVVSVAGATNLSDDVVATVDGYSGHIIIHDPETPPA